MDATSQSKKAELVPFALKDAPALIEKAFPASKVSFEAQRERKSVQSQTITGLGSYWKGRKPLLLVRAIVLGSLLPQTEDAELDLAIFEALMSFDLTGLARRAAAQDPLHPHDIANSITLASPWDYFQFIMRDENVDPQFIESKKFPLDADELGIRIKWLDGRNLDAKAEVYRAILSHYASYEARSLLGKRPEEVDEGWLLSPIWPLVNKVYAKFGVHAHSIHDLVAQFGYLRFGRAVNVGDVFSGGGSIPFEAARMGCGVYASDLNPIACMLTWGTLNIIGAGVEERERIDEIQDQVVKSVEDRINEMGIEHDRHGNRAKAFLYCLETQCPETGWIVPLSPTWVVSKSRKVVAKLIPDEAAKRFDIEIVSGVSKEEMAIAEKGTLQNGHLVYELQGKTYQVAIKTIRGDYRGRTGSGNKLRPWEKEDFRPRCDDVFQERLYAIQWIKADTVNSGRPSTYFDSVSEDDLERERAVIQYVSDHLEAWQKQGVVPDMAIEGGDETSRLRRERGWTHWHHLFAPRQILIAAITREEINKLPEKDQAPMMLSLAKMLDWSSKLCRYGTGAARESITQTFYNQAYNTNFFYGVRSFFTGQNYLYLTKSHHPVQSKAEVQNIPASQVTTECDLWVTDPPYADAVSYHEISEFFIAWLRKGMPEPFDSWAKDSKRSIAIKGSDDDFRRGMVQAYKAMRDHMPDNGLQCVMFTHQDTGVWSDMVGIFWAAGLQVVGAWYIATETSSELKKGGYVQGTVILMLRKRPEGDRKGFTRRIYPAVHKEVENQIEEMLHLNQRVEDHTGEPVFNDADLQMAGYAAALKVLTSYTEIGGEDVTTFALRPRQRGEKTVVDDIVQQASETANSLLVPDGLKRDTWQSINGIQRFYLRLLDIETTGASKLDNYQNFAKAFRVEDYTRVMASTAANSAKLKQVEEMTSRDLMDTTELGATHLGHLMVAIQQLLNDVDIKVVVNQLVSDLPDYFERRGELIDMTRFLALKATNEDVRHWAEVLGDRIANEQLA
ncbi:MULTISPECIES: anti-phage-associated DUF1156 domain-containing protein [unclassified Marinobacter]|jgi:adenine-specific DNA methylase|uniref:anti-phage-associated DUF1156 domain-containing protein n=1 Tax=unclassified Marinobacter TaxID=83889 RepID=UPI000C9389E6|nr:MULTISPECIES: anti-phage-associated DUF1156 domain-containing protein [unclassified Marinobacter]MAK49679.1 DNA methylase [Marinobacter sp.]|tara:strand:- start:5385 stop:8426 length:3042 start_codon:yes stop_codon:yes gene_type:complete